MISGKDARELPWQGPIAITVGVFDGVHRGHQAVLAQLRAVAPAGRALAVTLDPHPLAVLRPEFAPPLLTTAEERVRLLREIGPSPDAVIVRAFDRATAASAPTEFLAGLLPPGTTLASLVIGYDFRMGKDRTGGYEELRAIGAQEGFEVLRVPPTLDGDAPISSSRIRERIEAGDVAEAGRLLGHPYLVVGQVVPGRGVGRTLDFPTANVDVGKNGKLLPALGVYAVRVRILPDPERRPAVVNWGVRPTFGAGEPVLEVHIPGFRGDLTGRELALEVVDRIREERAFPDRQALVERIRRDVAEALERLQDAGEAPGKALPGSGRSDRLPG